MPILRIEMWLARCVTTTYGDSRQQPVPSANSIFLLGLSASVIQKHILLGLIVLSGSFGTCAFQLASIVILHFLFGPDLLDLDSLLYGRFTFMGLVSGIFLWLWVSFATQIEQSSRRRRLVLALCTLIVPITIIVVAYIRFAWKFLPKLFEFAGP